MFTLKFILHHTDDSHTECCIRCPHYEARKSINGKWCITTYPGMTAEHGVERWIGDLQLKGGPVRYDCCYVENENGKTIGNYHSPKKRSEQ